MEVIKLKKVHTGKDLVISAVIMAAGIGLYFVHEGLGRVVAVCGLLLLLFWKAGYKREGENIVLTKKALDVAHHCRQSLKDLLDGKGTEPEIDSNNTGGIIRLEVYYNAAVSVAYAQLFDFSSYTFEAATDIVELRGARADKLIAKI